MDTVTVRAPATTANLAAGFDTLGCALKLYNTLTFTRSDTLSFTGCDAAYQNADNLAYRGFACVYEHLGQPVPPVHIAIDAQVPISGGLGSSAAMLSAGAAAANALSGAALSTEELLALTTRIEGHPDNLAPAFFGGLTASMVEDGKVFTSRYTPHPALRFVALTPDFPLSTHAARAALPAQVPFGDAVYNLSRLPLLIRALEEGDEALLARSLRDKLHQPYRRPLIDEYADVERLASENGCRCVCVSGAGPTLLCLTRDAEFSARMKKDAAKLRHLWQVRDLLVDHQGISVIS
ncbi:MAG: homoserine kinase [Clostridia bacterium]|nr:homoserine kinase [Clostridia bacterium]